MTTRPTWPPQPAGEFGQFPHDHVQSDGTQNQDLAYPVIGEMAGLLRDTRDETLRAACLLASVAVALAVEARLATRALHSSAAFHALSLGLLAGLLGCLLTAIVLLAAASRPVVHALNELRWVTGAPLDTRPPWISLPPVGADPEQWTWIRAHLLVGAARLARERAQLADTWTCLTAGYFLIWTVIIVIGS